MRRQGIRADGLLKDGDNLIQRYRNLDARLQQQADAQSALEGECDKFNAQAESTRAWISDLLRALADPDTQTQEVKNKAKVGERGLKPRLHLNTTNTLTKTSKFSQVFMVLSFISPLITS